MDDKEYREIIDNMLLELNSIQGEIRSQIIILQSHVEFLIDEIIKILFETEEFRGTKLRLDKKLEILRRFGWVTNNTAKDIKLLSEIRGWIAHQINVHNEKTQEKIEEKLQSITLVKDYPKMFPGKNVQTNFKHVSELYIRALYSVVCDVQKHKGKESLKNPNPYKEKKARLRKYT